MSACVRVPTYIKRPKIFQEPPPPQSRCFPFVAKQTSLPPFVQRVLCSFRGHGLAEEDFGSESPHLQSPAFSNEQVVRIERQMRNPEQQSTLFQINLASHVHFTPE